MVSMIVPVYNVQDYLVECLDSICKQDYEDIEILVVDDGSTDESGKICDLYAEKDVRVKVIHQENRGLSGARNVGLASASGKYVMFIDSDDYVAPNYVSYMVEIMESNNNADMGICCFYNTVKQRNGNYLPQLCISKPEQFIMSGQDIIPKRFGALKVYYVHVGNKIYRRELFDNLCFPEGRTCEDAWISLDLYSRCRKVLCVDKPLYFYRNRPDSISHSKSINWIQAQLDWLEREISYFTKSENPGDVIYPARSYISFIYKNRYNLPLKINKQCSYYWEVAIKSLLYDDRITIIDKAKYCYYNIRFSIFSKMKL